MLKVALILLHFPPKWQGGTEIASSFMAKYLSKRGLETHVITSTDHQSRNEYVDNYVVHRIELKEIPIIGFIFFSWKLFFELKRIQPDIVQVHSIELGVPALFYQKVIKTPYIVYGRGSDIYDKKFRENFVLKYVWRNASLIFALTDQMKEQIYQITSTRIEVIPNGIDLAQTNGDIENNIVLKENDEKILIYVGSLRKIKGVDYLIDALKKLDDDKYNVKLVIIGDGAEKNNLIEQAILQNINHKIQFLGSVPHQKIFNYLQRSDILILPSFFEGFPNVILEAMAMGLPVVATNVSGNSEIITNGENGYLVESHNSNELAEKIAFLLSNEKMTQKISQNNLIKVQNYSWEKICSMLEKNYNSLL